MSNKPKQMDKCKCGEDIAHRRLGLCASCYKQKRKLDWQRNHEKRMVEDPNYLVKRRKINNKAAKRWQKENRQTIKQCRCGNTSMKGSIYSFCKRCSDENRKAKKLKYQLDRKKNHLPTRLRENIKSRLKQALKQNKSESIVQYLGCTMSFYIKYLESKFQPGMSWDNYGEWHIDHIVPLSMDFKDLSLHHYSNTQPIWQGEHFEKTARENGPKMS